MQEQAAPGPLFWIICLAVIVFEIAAMWKVFEKAGKPGWASIVPIYNAIGLMFLGFIFTPILAWGDAQYQPAA